MPTGVSSHKPSRLAKQLFESDLVQNDVDGQKESLQDSNADYAVIFGTAFGEDELDVGNFAIAHQDNNNMRRYACQSVQLERYERPSGKSIDNSQLKIKKDVAGNFCVDVFESGF